MLTPFFPNKSSFVGSYFLDQAKEIEKQIDTNFSVVVFDDLWSKSDDYTIEGIQCYIFKKIDFPSFFLPGFFQKLNNYRFSIFLKSKNIKLENSSIVHGHINYPSAPFLTFLKKKFICKTILQHHGLDVLQFKTGRINLFKKIRNKVIRNRFIKSLKYIDFQIGVSQKVVDNLSDIDSRIKNNSYVLYNGIDQSKFYPLEKESNLFKIGCVANFWELKDQITLIKALEVLVKNNVTDWQCEFIGIGPTKQKCINYIKTNNIPNITFTNKISHNDLNQLRKQ
jgi:glycosyltransferase involved in cell wall biosynthesis